MSTGPAPASTSYARIADRYEQVRGGAERARRLAAGLLPWLPPGGVVLDVGAGTGIVGVELSRVAGTVLGVDLAAEMIVQASDRLAGRIAVADATALPLPDGSVDAVTFVWVLHLVGDPRAAMREAARVLRPGGRVLAIWAHPRPAPPDERTAVDAIVRELDSLCEPAPGRAEQVAAGAADAGLRLLADETVTLEYVSSAADTADALEQRLFSWLWDLDDATWQETVAPRIARLRALPGAHVGHHRSVSHPLWVWGRPG